jgi:hypothetical protein
MPEAFQPLNEVSLQAVCVESIEITAAQVGIGAALSLKVISNHQDAVGNSNDGTLSAATSCKSLKLGRQIRVLGTCGGPRRLASHATQPGTSFANLATHALTCTLVVAWANAGPTSQMRCAWKLSNISAHLSDKTPGGHTVYTRNRDPTIQRVCQFEVLASDLIESSIQQRDLRF